MKLRPVLTSLAAAAAVGLSAPSWAAYVLSVNATPAGGTVGGQVVVAINLALGGGDTLMGVDFALGFDPAVLQYDAGVEGALTSGWAYVPFSDNGSGLISATMLDPNLAGLDSSSGDIDGSIARLTFDLIAPGTSALTFSDVVFLDNALEGRGATSALGSSIQVTAVPEPTSLTLSALGLLALLGWTRRPRVARRAG